MKKYFKIFLSVAIVTLMIAMFSGCSNESSLTAGVSDDRYGIFDGKNENFNATFVYGMRENPYRADGISNKTVEFGIISVTFSTPLETNATITYQLQIADNTISGTLEKSPFTNEYMADIGIKCKDNSALSLKLSYEGKEEVITLENKNSSWNIDHKKAHEIGIEALSSAIKNFEKQNVCYEIYVKIISEQETNFGTYYWTVSVIGTNGDKHSVVFGVNSDEILVKN